MTELLIPNRKEITVRQDGTRVLLIQDGRAILELPYQAALDLANAIRNRAKAAEEIALADTVILDQAILLRAGVGVGLAVDANIRKEAVKEAAWNTSLRRYIRTSKQAQAGTVYAPRVKRHKP